MKLSTVVAWTFSAIAILASWAFFAACGINFLRVGYSTDVAYTGALANICNSSGYCADIRDITDATNPPLNCRMAASPIENPIAYWTTRMDNCTVRVLYNQKHDPKHPDDQFRGLMPYHR